MAQKIEDVIITLELSVVEVNTILTSLSKQPLESVVSVWAKVKRDAEAQLAAIELEQPPANEE